MDIFKVRNELRNKSIFEVNLRVTFYARVSSERDEQINSLDNQINYYKDFIKNNKAWTYVEGYVDEGISGISTKDRQSFQQMIHDADYDKFDLIITKEISRFARNTLDSIQYTRELLSKGICVFFQNDNINTIDEDSELRLTIMSSIAQDELRKLSSRIKFGHSQAIKNGVVLGNDRIFGYKKEHKRLVIDEEEAAMVKLIFDLYASNGYSMKQIENVLYDKGYRNRNGKKIYHTTISSIISNPKYKGYYCGNKVKSIDLFTKTRKFLPKEEWVMYKDETGDIIPAIVSEEVWDKANIILKERSLSVKTKRNSHTHQNLFTKKIYCTCCNQFYYMKYKAGGGKYKHTGWVCSNKTQNGKHICKSFTIYEDISQKISELNDCISKLQEKKLFNSDTKTRINNIINSLKNAITFKSPDMIDRAFVLNYIEQINVTPIDNATAEIDIILLTGQSSKQNYAKSPKNYTKAQSKAKSDQQTSALQTVSNPSQINQMICLEHTTFINRTTRAVSGYNVLYKYNISVQMPVGID